MFLVKLLPSKPKNKNEGCKNEKEVINPGAWCAALTGPRIPASPPIREILNRLEPTILPKSMEVCLFSTKLTEAASSGRLVPIAKTVNPISSSGTPAS